MVLLDGKKNVKIKLINLLGQVKSCLHMGHTLDLLNQFLRQHLWKMWPHSSFLMICYSSKPSMQMGHVLVLFFMIMVFIFWWGRCWMGISISTDDISEIVKEFNYNHSRLYCTYTVVLFNFDGIICQHAFYPSHASPIQYYHI